jgi:phosphoribosylaminoimidazole-succinocarboxamide synthase
MKDLWLTERCHLQDLLACVHIVRPVDFIKFEAVSRGVVVGSVVNTATSALVMCFVLEKIIIIMMKLQTSGLKSQSCNARSYCGF